MARKRMIDPAIWQDEDMAMLSARQQLLFIGLFSNADDDGRLKGSPQAVKLMLPTIYANVSPDRVAGDLDGLCREMRHVHWYSVDARQYIEIDNFREWQRVDHPSPSTLPSFKEGDSENTREDSANAREDSRGTPPSLVKSSLGEVSLVQGSGGRARATTIDEPFTLSMIERYGARLGGEEGVRDSISLALEHAQKKGYRDLRAAVRNWLSGDRRLTQTEQRNGTARSPDPNFDADDLRDLGKRAASAVVGASHGATA